MHAILDDDDGMCIHRVHRKHLRFFFKEKVPATSLRILTPMSSHSYDDTYWSAKCRKAALETPTQDLLTKL